MRMNLQTERTELLPTSLLNLQSRSSTTVNSAASLLSAEDKDSIYTFSDNCNSDNDFLDHDKYANKYGTRLNLNASSHINSTSMTDRNLNDTRNTALKDTIRTYSKKKSSSSSSSASSISNTFSLMNDPRKIPITTTTMSSTEINTSCSPFDNSIPLSPTSDESNPQVLKPNGNFVAGTNHNTISISCICQKKK